MKVSQMCEWWLYVCNPETALVSSSKVCHPSARIFNYELMYSSQTTHLSPSVAPGSHAPSKREDGTRKRLSIGKARKYCYVYTNCYVYTTIAGTRVFREAYSAGGVSDTSQRHTFAYRNFRGQDSAWQVRTLLRLHF